MQMTMNTLCPPGRKLGQIAIILKGVGGKGLSICHCTCKVLEFTLCVGKTQNREMQESVRRVPINLFWYISVIVELPFEKEK